MGVLKLSETGIKLYVVKKWELKLQKSETTDLSQSTLIIDIKRTESIFYFLMMGELLSLVILFTETFIRKLQMFYETKRSWCNGNQKVLG